MEGKLRSNRRHGKRMERESDSSSFSVKLRSEMFSTNGSSSQVEWNCPPFCTSTLFESRTKVDLRHKTSKKKVKGDLQ